MFQKTLFITVLSLLVVLSAKAESVRLKFPAFKENIKVEKLKLEQVQGVVSCMFASEDKPGVKLRKRYVFTKISRENDNNYFLSLAKKSLTEWMPKLYLRSCSYALIVIGRTLDGEPLIGDINLMGNLKAEMTKSELSKMKNKTFAAEYIAERLANLVLVIKENKKGNLEIVEQDKGRASLY